MKMKLNRGILLGESWHEAGSVIDAGGKYAELLTRSGAAAPVAVAVGVGVEQATAGPKSAERATSPRQRA